MLAYRLSYSIARDSIMNSVRFSSDQAAQSIAHRLGQMEKVSDFTQYQLYRLSSMPQEYLSAYIDRFSEVRSSIDSLVYSFDLYSVNIFMRGHDLITYNGLMFAPLEDIEDYGLSIDSIINSDDSRQKWFLLNNVEVKRVPVKPGKTGTYLSCCRIKKNITTDEVDYIFLVTLPAEDISPLLTVENEEKDVVRFLVSADTTIAAHPSAELVGSAAQEVTAEMLANPSETYQKTRGGYTSVQHMKGYEWLLVTYVSDQYISQRTNVLISLLMLTMFSILAAISLVISFLSRSMSKKLHLLAHTMRRYKTSNDTKGLSRLSAMVNTDVSKRDEFDEIAVDFNDMTIRLEDNYRQMMDMQLREQKLNQKLLQAKINPHFLYNILESIKACQSVGKIEIANQMITKLVRFYRQQLVRTEELVELGEEIDAVCTYLEIERLSRGDLLHWRVELDEGIDSFMICRFSLQPVLENCIQHGLPGNEKAINIIITVHYEDDSIRITIQDDGKGMDQDKLREVRHSLRELSVDTERHFGICNVNARLAVYNEHKGSCVDIESKPGKGTIVTIHIDQMLD